MTPRITAWMCASVMEADPFRPASPNWQSRLVLLRRGQKKKTREFRPTSSEAATAHTSHTSEGPNQKSSLFLLLVMSVRRWADSHAVQSRSSEDGSERPCPGCHPALHLDHTWWDSVLVFFLFGFAGDLFFKAESVSFSFSRSEKQVLNTDSLSSLSLGRVHPVTASVLKLLSSKTEDLFLLNLLWICSSRCLLREIKYFGCSRGWEHLSVESKRHKRLKSKNKEGRYFGLWKQQTNKLPACLSLRRGWRWTAAFTPTPESPHFYEGRMDSAFCIIIFTHLLIKAEY